MSGERVLIVEDDPALLRGLRDNFAARGYRVSTAADGEAGLQAALDKDPDLILLDIMLPGVNGFEICRTVRERELDVPIIMLTAKGQEEDIVRGLDLGADDYVTKPFSIQELLARARAFLRRQAAGAQEHYRFGDCRLDLVSRRLSRNGREVELTPKEFGLLEYLAGNGGRALTRDQILQAVWGSGVLVTTRSVDRCVSTLRSKVEPDPRYPTYIQTVRAIGYRFEMPTAPDTEDGAAELLEGESLRQRLERGLPEWVDAVRVAVAVAEGLAAAHAKGLVHRDIKPENIFLPHEGAARILDFGRAHLEPRPGGQPLADGSTVSLVTEPGRSMGTVAYLSPEQVKGQRIDWRSDIFSLGCVLHEMLCGQPPFARGSAAETMAAILADESPALPDDGRLPAALRRVVQHCLEKEPAERFQSALDLAFALRGLD